MFKHIISIAALLGASACGAISAAQGGVQGVTDQANGISSIKEQTSQLGEKGKGLTDSIPGLGGKKDGAGGAAPPNETGDDDDRLKAKDAPINEPIDDKVSFAKDKNDWRKVILTGRHGIATFELHWDEPMSDLDLDIFDAFGERIGQSPRRLAGSQVKKILVELNPGLIYYRVSATHPADKSIYTVALKWGGGARTPKPPKEEKSDTHPAAAGGAEPAAGGPPAAAPAPTPFAMDPSKLVGGIAAAYREGSGLVIYLDKGSKAGVRVGMTGNVLDGAEGDKLVDGATIVIKEIIDSEKAVAHSSFTKSLGKNNRFVLNLR